MLYICALVHSFIRYIRNSLIWAKDAKGSVLPNVGYAKKKIKSGPDVAYKNETGGKGKEKQKK